MKCVYIFLAAVMMLGFSSAWAGEKASHKVLDKRFTIYGGIQEYYASGEVSSTREGRRKVTIDLDDLDLDENEITLIAGGRFKLSKRLGIRFDYYGYHENGERSAGFDFNYEDLVVPVGARIDTSLDLDIYVANVFYNIIHTDRSRLGLGIGAHVADIDFNITADAQVGETETRLGEGDENFVAPVPNIYAYWAYALSNDVVFRSGAGWMSLTYDDFEGDLVFANAFLEYWPLENVGVGAGYRYVNADIEYDPGDKVETYDVTLPGPMVYMTVGF